MACPIALAMIDAGYRHVNINMRSVTYMNMWPLWSIIRRQTGKPLRDFMRVFDSTGSNSPAANPFEFELEDLTLIPPTTTSWRLPGE